MPCLQYYFYLMMMIHYLFQHLNVRVLTVFFVVIVFSGAVNPKNHIQNVEFARKVRNVQGVMRQEASELRKAPQNFNKEAFDRLGSVHPKGLSNMKIRMENRVKQAQLKVNNSKALSLKEKDFKLHVLEMFLEELRESEKDMLAAEESLKKSLTMDFWNASTLKENSRRRLEALQMATLKEQKSFSRMHDFEMKMKKYMDGTNSTSWMGEIIKEIAQAADRLEDRVGEHELSAKDIQQGHGAFIEAVVHVKEGMSDTKEERNYLYDKENTEDDRLDVLIDSKSNKFILTRLKDPTSPVIDHFLVMDIIMIFMLSIPLGYVCHAVSLPSLFGYILAGLILGPAGLNWIEEMIQVETLGEFGVFMIMFCTGLEFSVEKIRKVWRIAVQAPILITFTMLLFGVVIGLMIDAPTGECAFVSACLSLSSTPLITRFLQGSNRPESSSGECSIILVAMLVVQDVQLSCIIALIPGLAVRHTGESLIEHVLHSSSVIAKTLLALILVVVVASTISRFVMPMYARFISNQTRELQLLGALAVMYCGLSFTSFLGISMELGCFAAGAMISYSSHLPSVEEKAFALHDFMSVLFFASIGFHVFPTFVFFELTLLTSLTAFVVAGKYVICLLVLRLVLPPQTRKLKWIMSSGLAQVSEFAFVLGSRAKHFKIISREVYLLILSVTTLSLILAPLLWKLSIWRYRVRNLTEHMK